MMQPGLLRISSLDLMQPGLFVSSLLEPNNSKPAHILPPLLMLACHANATVMLISKCAAVTDIKTRLHRHTHSSS